MASIAPTLSASSAAAAAFAFGGGGAIAMAPTPLAGILPLSELDGERGGSGGAAFGAGGGFGGGAFALAPELEDLAFGGALAFAVLAAISVSAAL